MDELILIEAMRPKNQRPGLSICEEGSFATFLTTQENEKQQYNQGNLLQGNHNLDRDPPEPRISDNHSAINAQIKCYSSESESESESAPRERHDSDLDEPEEDQNLAKNTQETIEEQRVHRNRAFFETISKALGIRRESEHVADDNLHATDSKQKIDANRQKTGETSLRRELTTEYKGSRVAEENYSEEKAEHKDDLLFKRKEEELKVEQRELELLIRDNVRRVT